MSEENDKDFVDEMIEKRAQDNPEFPEMVDEALERRHSIPDEEVFARDMEDPEFRALWEATELKRLTSIFFVHLRATYELSQEQLAEELEVDVEMVKHLEAGP